MIEFFAMIPAFILLVYFFATIFFIICSIIGGAYGALGSVSSYITKKENEKVAKELMEKENEEEYKRYRLTYKYNEWEKKRARIHNRYTKRINEETKNKILNIISKGK